jgi:hypothetical protein
MIDEREQEIEEAEKVAAYVSKKIGLSFGIVESQEWSSPSESDIENGIFVSMYVAAMAGGDVVYPKKYSLQFLYCQYDTIPTEKFAELGVIVSEPNGNRYHIGEKIGELDISGIPEFKDFPQKKYSILANYYNSHESGW